MKKWIGVELDGTLAKYNKQSPRDIGEPINAMLLRVQGWLNEGQTVKILTDRASATGSNYQLKNWLRDNGLSAVEVVPLAEGMATFWSDRAVRVETNEGKLCKGCGDAPEMRHSLQSHGREKFVHHTVTDC